MKKIRLLSFILVILVIACKQQPKTQPVDIESAKAALKAIINRFEAATSTDTLASFMTDDAIVAGTAPSELYNKQQMIEMWRQYYSGVVPEHKYINESTIKIAADGNSATVIEEYNMPVMSQVIPARNALHMVKINGKWMIDFINICFIPENEDIPKIDELLRQ
jgi:ketosteroid isomerase-like protein